MGSVGARTLNTSVQSIITQGGVTLDLSANPLVY